MGSTYTFIVQARNAYGYGANSTASPILCATVPNSPSPPTTTFSPDSVTIKWTIPATNGAAVTAYIITIRGSDLATYTADTTNCNGATASVVSTLNCTIPVSVLRAAPYNLPYGSSIWSKVTAINIQGASPESNPGNGAIIITYPDAPTGLTENLAGRTSSTLGMSWTQAAFNGGATVLDYRVSMST
jgi:hypothetical protein